MYNNKSRSMSLRSRPVPPRQDAALVVQLQEEVITRVVFGETGARGIFKLDGGGGVGILRLRRRGHEGALGGTSLEFELPLEFSPLPSQASETCTDGADLTLAKS
jgi:hypothetical protein